MRALALRLSWEADKQQHLNQLLNLFVAVPLPFSGIIDAYARIDHHCVKNGLSVGKNDLWIVATAHVTGATVLTTDHDFDPLHGLFLQRDWRDWVDPASRLETPF